MKLLFGLTRTQIALCLGALILTVLNSLHFNTLSSQAQSQATTDSPPIEITQGWQYRWGDFPRNNVGVPIWTQQETSSSGWRSFDFPEKFSKERGQDILWLRASLPDGDWAFPMLYLRSIPFLSDAYLDNQRIYTQTSREDYQWPIVPLQQGMQGKTLLFRVDVGNNSSVYVGMFDRVIVGSQTDLIKQLILQEIDAILSIFFIFLGLIASFLAFNRQEKQAYLSFGALAILVGLYTIVRSDFITLFFKNAVFFHYIHFISFYLIPVSACIFLQGMFGEQYRAIIRRLGQIHLTYAIVALPLAASKTITWGATVFPTQLLLLSSALILLMIAIRTSLSGNWEARLFTFGFAIFTLCAVHDVLIYIFEPVDCYQKIYPWGTLIFILVLGFILERRFSEARQDLQNYAIELEANNAALQRLDKLKDEFLANTSHELKTPLNGIIGIAESLMDGATGQLSKSTLFNLSLIVSSGKRLAQLVNDLLDFSQLRHKKLELGIKPVGMREITDVVLMLSRPLVGQKNLQLINTIAPDIPPVAADENRVQQILHNLVGNAIKFTESGTVEVSAIALNKQLEITVADTGIGIEPERLDRIFESFEQADGSIARKYGGVGLGLAITKQLVQLHGGEIRVESTPGVGSRFTFTLPLSKAPRTNTLREEASNVQKLAALTEISDEVLSDGQAAASTEGAFKILIVDDEPINLQVLVNHLSLQNYAITQALNGMQALEIIRRGFIPDLILLDIMMPQMTGYELCKRIREHFPANELPVVFLTAKDRVSDLVEGFGVGANDYLTKPVSKNELLARIKTHLQLAKINTAYGRFVPHEFLQFLERESIIDVHLGDQVQKEMTVLFADIRSFTTLSERMSPKENFDFINAYLSRVSPVIRNHHGFIDKYIGDAIMALFPQTSDDAVQAAIDMQKQVALYNVERVENREEPIAIGIGLHTGSLMLGTVGESERMEGTVIADAVNLASRLEGLTKIYGVDILISEQTLYRLNNRQNYHYRFLGRYKVKGKSQSVDVFEVWDVDLQSTIDLKMQTRAEFERGVALFLEEKFAEAQHVFQQVLQKNEHDRAARLYLERCQNARPFGVSQQNIVIT